MSACFILPVLGHECTELPRGPGELLKVEHGVWSNMAALMEPTNTTWIEKKSSSLGNKPCKINIWDLQCNNLNVAFRHHQGKIILESWSIYLRLSELWTDIAKLVEEIWKIWSFPWWVLHVWEEKQGTESINSFTKGDSQLHWTQQGERTGEELWPGARRHWLPVICITKPAVC